MQDLKHGLAARVSQLQAQLARQDPHALASRAGARIEQLSNSQDGKTAALGVIHLLFWGKECLIPFDSSPPVWQETGKSLGLLDQGLVYYYLSLTDGLPLSGDWIAFTELPDGRFYTQAFQSYTGRVLKQVFDSDLLRFASAASAVGGTPVELGDIGFSFHILPHVAAAVVAWLGDEDFPTHYQVLFDAVVSHHLTTDGCAVLGSSLVRRLVKTQPD
jgi:hypothetical protein